MNNVISDKELMVISVMFLTLFPDSQIKKAICKRERKAIIRAFNKAIAIARNTLDKPHYLKIVYEANDVRIRAFEKMSLEGCNKERLSMVSPSGMIDNFNKKDPSLLSRVEIKDSHLESIRKAYSESNVGFTSLMYVNRLLDEIDKGLENIKEVSDEEIMEISNNIVRK